MLKSATDMLHSVVTSNMVGLLPVFFSEDDPVLSSLQCVGSHQPVQMGVSGNGVLYLLQV